MDNVLEIKNKRVTFAINVFIVMALALTATACASSSDSTDASQNLEQMSPTESQPEAQTDPAAEAAPGSGAYISLTDYQSAKESYIDSKVVLFFNAKWCSTCKKARSNLEADLTAIPADLAIVLVDFDSETDLKRKYGVTVQHTFVQIDADGNELAKWSGSLTAQKIAEKTV
jgi:thiol-disulfide isomerase/thioredoxin